MFTTATGIVRLQIPNIVIKDTQHDVCHLNSTIIVSSLSSSPAQFLDEQLDRR